MAKQNIITVPNAMTLLRALAIPWVFLLILNNPGRNWWIAAAFALTDNIDGILARLEDKSNWLKSLGFRRSETGRRLDPVVDKMFITSIIIAGALHGVIPVWLGGFSLAQKLLAGLIVIAAQKRSTVIHVSRQGKYAEFITNCGFLLLLASAAIPGSTVQDVLQIIAICMALLGIGIGLMADVGYARKADLLQK